LPLDGELWINRQQFEQVSGSTRKQHPIDQEWQKISFMIFDLPASDADFTSRLQQMKTLINSSDSAYLKMIKQQRIENNEQLQSHIHK
jgi:DNA ligase-1